MTSQKNRKPGPKRPDDRAHETANYWLYGTHPVRAALDNPARKKHQLRGTRNALNNLGDISMDATMVDRKAIDHLVGRDAVHQGLALEVSPLPEFKLKRVLADKATANLVVLDQVTDPHNVGAVMRSAAAFGASAVVTTWRHSPPETAVLAKTAAGSLELAPYIRESNLADCLIKMQKAGFTIIGLDGDGDHIPSELPALDRFALVLGAEGKGLRKLTRDLCDFMVRLPISDSVESLNVSNAAAVALYALTNR